MVKDLHDLINDLHRRVAALEAHPSNQPETHPSNQPAKEQVIREPLMVAKKPVAEPPKPMFAPKEPEEKHEE